MRLNIIRQNMEEHMREAIRVLCHESLMLHLIQSDFVGKLLLLCFHDLVSVDCACNIASKECLHSSYKFFSAYRNLWYILSRKLDDERNNPYSKNIWEKTFRENFRFWFSTKNPQQHLFNEFFAFFIKMIGSFGY